MLWAFGRNFGRLGAKVLLGILIMHLLYFFCGLLFVFMAEYFCYLEGDFVLTFFFISFFLCLRDKEKRETKQRKKENTITRAFLSYFLDMEKLFGLYCICVFLTLRASSLLSASLC